MSSTKKNRPLTAAELLEEAENIMNAVDDEEEIQSSGSESEEDVLEKEVLDSDDYADLDSDDEIPAVDDNDSASAPQDIPAPSVESDADSDDMPLSQVVANASVIIPQKTSIKGKNGHRWSTVERKAGRTPARNLVHFVPGSKGPAKHLMSQVECFRHFFNDHLLDTIVRHTNERIREKSAKYSTKTATVAETCKEEILALIGLLVFSAAMKNNHLNAKQMFNPILSGNIYRATMSRDRFLFLLDSLRFDDRNTRTERVKDDAFAPIRDIWEILIDACRSSYTPSFFIYYHRRTAFGLQR